MGHPHDTQAYAAYRAEVEGDKLIADTRRTSLLVIGLNTSFAITDALIYPELFWQLLGIRTALNALLAVIWVRTAQSHPVASAYIGCLAIGLGMIAVIQPAGGLIGDYYPGVILLFAGMPVLMPYTRNEAAALSSIVLLLFSALPFRELEIDWSTYLGHLFFTASAAVICIVSCSRLDAYRFQSFLQRIEIENARDDLKALDREKSRFTANVHHELRTPLTLMLAPVDGLLDGDFGPVPPQQQRYLETVRANGLRLLRLINNLLDLAKAESRQLSIVRRPVLAQSLLDELLAQSAPLAERKDVQLNSRGLADLPVLNADADALDKIFVNLIGNALKFTAVGGTIDIVGTELNGRGVRISVNDDGIGLSHDQLERVFDRFAQVDSSATRRHEGSGIGLSLARELVELHGGRIWAESEGIGHGATVVVELPTGVPDEATGVAPDPDGTPHAAQASRKISAAADASLPTDSLRPAAANAAGGQSDNAIPFHSGENSDRPSILICDDNSDMRDVIAGLLASEFRVRTAANGREGLDSIHSNRPDLVLTDLMMPEMSGTELCSAIKGDASTEQIPVVLVTSKADREMRLEALELGADEYITKPFHPRELRARVRSMLRPAQLRQKLEERNILLAETNSELEAALSKLREASVQLARSERLAAVGELAAGVAHEVNNPMNFALNALGTLESYVKEIRDAARALASPRGGDEGPGAVDEPDTDQLEENIEALLELAEIIGDGLDRTQRLVTDLKDFAAPGSGAKSAVDLVRAIRSTSHLLKFAARDAGVTIQLDLPASLPMVEGNTSELNQVLLNVVKNALDASRGSGGTIRVGASLEGSLIAISVDDSGPGIHPDVLGRVFEPFFTTKEAGQGSGLGLSISHRIAQDHGGKITAETTQTGARFVLTLPVPSP